MSTHAIIQIPPLPFPRIGSGKVREIFDAGHALIIVATDRISAFDHVLDPGIPGKGEILTQISHLWFNLLTPLVHHHRVPGHDTQLQHLLPNHKELWSRSMVVRKLQPLPIEAVVRGYLAGSAWTSYLKSGKAGEFSLPSGLREAARLPEPLFTPSTKSNEGHDEPIDFSSVEKLVGRDTARQVRSWSLQIYRWAEKLARSCGLILADTKFEFGLDDQGELWLIDEVLTPDSSRYWPAENYQEGQNPPSFDKQFVRNFLLNSNWDRTVSPPSLPDNIVLGTENRYLEAWKRIQSLRQSDPAESLALWNASASSPQ